MRITTLIVAGSLAAVALTMPALAKHAESQKSEDKSTSSSSSCHAYQQAEDGSWTALPCQQAGGVHTEHKPAGKGSTEEEQR